MIIEIRLEEEASVATVNRELEALRRMLNLGEMAQKVDRAPPIKNLKGNNTRKGFFEREASLALRKALPVYMKGFVTFAYRTGCRRQKRDRHFCKSLIRYWLRGPDLNR